jgi:hypothetical protein
MGEGGEHGRRRGSMGKGGGAWAKAGSMGGSHFRGGAQVTLRNGVGNFWGLSLVASKLHCE